jgi:hypothetical protein
MGAKLFAQKRKADDNGYSNIPVWIWVLGSKHNFLEISDS